MLNRLKYVRTRCLAPFMSEVLSLETCLCKLQIFILMFRYFKSLGNCFLQQVFHFFLYLYSIKTNCDVYFFNQKCNLISSRINSQANKPTINSILNSSNKVSPLTYQIATHLDFISLGYRYEYFFPME